ncbi:MAG: hypothetical protein HY646_16040 [Acidobacteria bacterium]|nr:hypothetical protein [Acidobacteriota bacterium]
MGALKSDLEYWKSLSPGKKIITAGVLLGLSIILLKAFAAFDRMSDRVIDYAGRPRTEETPAILDGSARLFKSFLERTSGNANTGKKKLIKFDASYSADSRCFQVHIDFNANKPVFSSPKRMVEGDIGGLYYLIYAPEEKNPNICRVSITAFLPLVDKYGNESDEPVYTTELAATEAGKINWNVDRVQLQYTIIPRVWTARSIHPALEK